MAPTILFLWFLNNAGHLIFHQQYSTLSTANVSTHLTTGRQPTQFSTDHVVQHMTVSNEVNSSQLNRILFCASALHTYLALLSTESDKGTYNSLNPRCISLQNLYLYCFQCDTPLRIVLGTTKSINSKHLQGRFSFSSSRKPISVSRNSSLSSLAGDWLRVIPTGKASPRLDAFQHLYRSYVDYILSDPTYLIEEDGNGQPIVASKHPQFMESVETTVLGFVEHVQEENSKSSRPDVVKKTAQVYDLGSRLLSSLKLS